MTPTAPATPALRRRSACSAAASCRVRPPVEGEDWCDWEGGRDEFVQLVHAARSAGRSYQFATYGEFAAHKFPDAEPLLGAPGAIYLAAGSLLMVYGPDGSGKSTWTIDGVVHLAAGADWLGVPVPRPVRVCIIENEGPPSLLQQKLAAKLGGWEGRDPAPNLFVFCGPWGEFSFADADARAALNAYCDEHRIDVVTANPTLGLGVAATGRPDETQQFVDWLTECGLKSVRAFWLLHENKAGHISGDWGRHPDTKASLQRDGSRQRTRLDWNKTRWATPAPEEKLVMLEWALETQGYNVVPLDAGGASDDELEQRIRDYLDDNPLAPTNAAHANVKGTNERITALLKSRFDCVSGRGMTKLWLNPARSSETPDDEPTTISPNPHE
jgi:hypothetical protein